MGDSTETSDFLGVFGVLEREGSVLLAANRRQLGRASEKTLVFDLPGGGIEAGESCEEALLREWREETGLAISCGAFLFMQEGVKVIENTRDHVWRSFFFRVEASGSPRPLSEIESLLWCPLSRVDAVLHAPYHRAFRAWLRSGRSTSFFRDTWDGDTLDSGQVSSSRA